jgi:hypothetical protein
VLTDPDGRREQRAPTRGINRDRQEAIKCDPRHHPTRRGDIARGAGRVDGDEDCGEKRESQEQTREAGSATVPHDGQRRYP